jgi:nucleoside-diphosphate-sugar epimerase
MKCLVTGAAGFIGSALVKRLVKEGYEVKALLHNTKPKIYEKKAEYIFGDITEIESIKPFFKDVDFVFHCAAIVKDYGPKNFFYKINLEGTKNLVKISEEFKIKKFIFLSHIRYEDEKVSNYYSYTKALAEQYLIEKFKKDNFPTIIIRPGNVYGPGATTWVLRPLKSIKENKISLIDHGKGIFLHTYIDNLLDAIIAALKEPKALGEIIDVTDGDNDITWGEYFNTVAKIAGKPNIKRNMSRKTALFVSKLMIFLNKLFKIEPWVTPMAVRVLTNQHKVSTEKAKNLLGYNPKVDFQEGIKKVEIWLKNENYIS